MYSLLDKHNIKIEKFLVQKINKLINIAFKLTNLYLKLTNLTNKKETILQKDEQKLPFIKLMYKNNHFY